MFLNYTIRRMLLFHHPHIGRFWSSYICVENLKDLNTYMEVQNDIKTHKYLTHHIHQWCYRIMIYMVSLSYIILIKCTLTLHVIYIYIYIIDQIARVVANGRAPRRRDLSETQHIRLLDPMTYDVA